MKNIPFIVILFFSIEKSLSQCDTTYTYFGNLPNNVTILVGDSCLSNNDIAVLDSIIIKNNLIYSSPLELGTQTWFNGRLRFLVAGNYGNSSGVNDTIYFLPDNMGDLDNLASLYLEWNRISELPESFKKLTTLFSLYINNNLLSSLGDSIGNLSNLYFLDLGYNQLSSIPETICQLENLSYLWLFNNQLETLPDCFCSMGLDWSSSDDGGYPYFAIGANNLCENVPDCVSGSENFELSLDQFYYSFPVYSPQDCDSTSNHSGSLIYPYQYTVSTPYPNPFNPIVNIDLTTPYDRKFEIKIYDSIGRTIDQISTNDIYSRGLHSISWNASQHPSGVYFIKFTDGSEITIRKIALLK